FVNFFFTSRRRHTRSKRDWSSDVCSSDLAMAARMFGVFIGSLVFGYLSDKIGVKKTSIFAMILGLLSIVLLLVFPDYVAVILIALMLFGFVTASIGTIAPAMTSALF